MGTPVACEERERPRQRAILRLPNASSRWRLFLHTVLTSFLSLGLTLGLALSATAPAIASEPLDVLGTWFVLIHFHDSATANPDSWRWADKVWTFEEEKNGLRWHEYPIVVFENTQGRFEARGGNARARTLEKWEPNEEQRKTINGGPRVNQRGEKNKALRGTPAKGYKSSARMQTRSAFTVGYREDLYIENLDDMPVFRRQDAVGTAGAATTAGTTEYKVTSMNARRSRMSGEYQRDGHQIGVFRMWRTPAPRGLIQREGTVNERAHQRAFEAARKDFERRLKEGDPEAIRELKEIMESQQQDP